MDGEVKARESGARGANTGDSCYQVNEKCHGSTGPIDLKEADGRVLANPVVHVLYWDDYFLQNQPAVDLMNRFFTEILKSNFMLGLEQYHVGMGEFGKHWVEPSPLLLPKMFSRNEIGREIEQKLIQLFNEKKLPAPHKTTPNELYVIFTPNHFHIEEYGGCVCGFHDNGRENKNLFWAAIQEWHHNDELPASKEAFVDSCTWCVSHEMVEAFTNPDGNGYQTPEGCEIGDICECAQGSVSQKTPIIKAQVRGWMVETYWDKKNQSCYPLHIVPRREHPEVGYQFYQSPKEVGEGGSVRSTEKI